MMSTGSPGSDSDAQHKEIPGVAGRRRMKRTFRAFAIVTIMTAFAILVGQNVDLQVHIPAGDDRHQDSTKTIYPSPTRDGTRPIIKPTFGKHRPHVDAMFALAEGYDLKIYLLFIESIKQTGFTGDLVLSVSAISELKHGVEDYLRSQQREEGEAGINIVGYTVTWTCYEGDGVTVAKGANEGVRKCALVDMYGDSTDGTAIKDPREPRPVATARYELYWAWSLHYDPHSWMMLIDSRDAYFQLNPFSTVERENESSRDDGLLYFFEVSISNYRDHLSGSIHILPTCVPQPKWRLAGK